MKQTRQPVLAIKQSIYLDVYGNVSGCHNNFPRRAGASGRHKTKLEQSTFLTYLCSHSESNHKLSNHLIMFVKMFTGYALGCNKRKQKPTFSLLVRKEKVTTDGAVTLSTTPPREL